MAHDTTKGVAFGTAARIHTMLAPRVLTLEEFILGQPSALKAFELTEKEPVVVSMAPQFCTIEFNVNDHGKPNLTKSIACAKFVEQALNGARPEWMKESIASSSGSSVRISKNHLTQALNNTRMNDPEYIGLSHFDTFIDMRVKAARMPQERDESFVQRTRGARPTGGRHSDAVETRRIMQTDDYVRGA